MCVGTFLDLGFERNLGIDHYASLYGLFPFPRFKNQKQRLTSIAYLPIFHFVNHVLVRNQLITLGKVKFTLVLTAKYNFIVNLQS